MHHRLSRLCALAMLTALAPAQVWAQAAPGSLDVCQAQIDRNPGGPLGYYCIYRWVLAGGSPDRAVTTLQRYFRQYPKAYRIEMFIAWINRIRERAGWQETLGRAVDGMESTADDYGVVYGGLMLAFELGAQGRLAESEALLSRCARAAGRTGDTTMQARVWVGQGVLAARRQDYSQDIHLLRRAERAVFPDGPYDIRSAVLDNLGSDYWYLRQYRKAYGAFKRATQLRVEAHDLWWQAFTVYGTTLCAMGLMDQREMAPEAVDRLLKRGLNLAVESRNAEIEAGLYVLTGRRHQGEAARRQYRQALKIARRGGYAAAEIGALEGIGNSLAKEGPQFRQRAKHHLDEAVSRARETGQLFLLAQVLASKAGLTALYGTPREAVQAHLEALDYIEDLRTPQIRGAVRAQAFSRWDYVYYRLAGLLLARAGTSATPAEDCALAFRTMERFRARELLDRLQTPRKVPSAMVASDLYRQHGLVQWRIAGVQQALADPDLKPAGRKAALGRLGNLEEDESRLRDELQRRFPDLRETVHSAIPDLREVQRFLGPGQALLSYQLWDGEPDGKTQLEIGKSWLFLVTRDRVQPIALPARRDLRDRIGILNGLLKARNTAPRQRRRAEVRLFGDLLAQALAALPGNVGNLVIVPDDALFRCPFGALRPAKGASPVGRRYEIAIVPSVGVWVQLKARALRAGREPRSAALILYAPTVGRIAGNTSGFRSAGPWREGLNLSQLPHAAEEAQALLKAAGAGSRMLTGADASEAALKGMPLAAYGILDLVTHAVVDEEQPERSAIILAQGGENEDGFLQVREIPELSLDGQLVILSSCGSSSGQLLGGEGAQSLARAFLGAGAGAVVASLWPLEDREAAALLGHFSKALGRGRSVSEALRTARSSSMDAGMPPAGWAGVIVLGNGDLRPLSGGWPHLFWGLGAVTAVLILLLGFSLAKRSH